MDNDLEGKKCVDRGIFPLNKKKRKDLLYKIIKNKKLIEDPKEVFHYSLKSDVILVFNSYLAKIENMIMEYFYLQR